MNVIKPALAASLVFAAIQAQAQGTITLSGAPGNSCEYTQVTMTPDGNTTVACRSAIVDPPAQGCPSSAGSVAGSAIVNDFQSVDALKMASGVIGYYPVPASPTPASVIVEFSQTQMAVTPSSVVTEFQVSPCPGVFDPPGIAIANSCKQRGVFANINNMKIWTAPTAQYPNQAALDAAAPGNCMATGKQYINVRWTYPSCPYAGCGFSNRWNQYNANTP